MWDKRCGAVTADPRGDGCDGLSMDDPDAWRARQRRSFGGQLRQLRKDARLTLDGLGAAAKLSPQWLSQLELGKYQTEPKWPDIQAHVEGCLAQLDWDRTRRDEKRRELRRQFDLVVQAHQDAGARRIRAKPPGLQAYLDHVRERWANLDLSMLSALSDPNMPVRRRTLAGQFVEPHLSPLTGTREPVPASAILDQSKVSAVIGEPGTGKSALLQYFAWSAAANGDGPVPFLVPVNDLADWDWSADGELFPLAYLEKDAAAAGLTLPAGTVRELLAAGRCLFLVDGLDEADAVTTTKLQRRLKYLAMAARGHTGNRLVVTTRPSGRDALADLELDGYGLDGFSWSDVERFARKWDRHDGGPAPRYSLLTSVRDPRVRRLMTRPLYLTVVALLHSSERGLVVEQRDDVFRRLTEHMLHRDRRKGLRHVDALPFRSRQQRLEEMALWMLERTDGGAEPALAADEMRRRLARYLMEVDYASPGEAADQAEAFLDWAVHRSGFVALTSRSYVFRHAVIQQYLASCAMYARYEADPGGLIEDAARRVPDPRWTEVVLFLASRLGRNLATRLVAAVADAPVEYAHLTRRNVLMAVRVMAECHQVDRDVQRSTVRALCRELDAGPAPAGQRLSGSWQRIYRECLSLLPTLRGTPSEIDLVTWLLDRLGPAHPPAVRARACELLGILGTTDERAVAALFAAMRGGEEPTVQDNARRALASICRFQENLIGRLEELAADPTADAATRRHAGRALMQLHRGYDLTLRLGLTIRSNSKARGFLGDWLRSVAEEATDPFGTWADDKEAVTRALRDAVESGHELATWVYGSAGLTDDPPRVPKPARSPHRVPTESTVDGEYLGDIVHYWPENRSGVVNLVRPLRIGALLRVWSPDTRRRHGTPVDFTQRVDSMEVEHVAVTEAEPGTSVSIKFTERVRPGDHVSVVPD